MNMGSRIAKRLQDLGWKQVDLLNRVPELDAGALSALMKRDSKTSQLSEEIAAALGVHHRWLQTGEEPELLSNWQDQGVASDLTEYAIEWDKPTDLPQDAYALVERRAVKLSAGDGRLTFEEERLPPLAFRAEFLRRKRASSRNNLVIVYAEGESMEPFIMDGDVVLIDRGQVEIIDNEIYAIDYGGYLKIKRLQKRFDGGILIKSDNAMRFPLESIEPDHTVMIKVLGRFLWRGG